MLVMVKSVLGLGGCTVEILGVGSIVLQICIFKYCSYLEF